MKLDSLNDDLSDLIRMYNVGPLLDDGDIRRAVLRIYHLDSDEATIDFIKKYLNVTEMAAIKLFYDYTSN